MPDVVLRWRGALDADLNTDYKIRADKSTPGTFADVVTQDAVTPFTPVATTLNTALVASDTVVVMSDGANFSEADYVTIDREMILLGPKATNTFSACTRGIGSTIPVAHSQTAAIYKAHETYTDAAVSFGSRFVIRYQVIRVQGSDQSVISEVLAVNPPVPDTTDLCTVWGILQDITGDVQVSASVTMTIANADDYLVGTAENIKSATETTSTDADGFFSFQVPRSASRAQNRSISIIAAGNTWTLATVPDANSANVNEIS